MKLVPGISWGNPPTDPLRLPRGGEPDYFFFKNPVGLRSGGGGAHSDPGSVGLGVGS